MCKLLIGVLSTKTTSSSITGVEDSKLTWASKDYPDTTIQFYHGITNNTDYDDLDVVVNVNENPKNILLKTIEYFKYTLQFEYDYLYRINSSSYIHIDKLKKYLNDKPKDKFLACVRNFQLQIQKSFPSGSGYILSRDLVEEIVNNDIEYVIEDDVSIGLFLNSLGVKYNIVPRGNYENNRHGLYSNIPGIECFHWYYKGNTNKFIEHPFLADRAPEKDMKKKLEDVFTSLALADANLVEF